MIHLPPTSRSGSRYDSASHHDSSSLYARYFAGDLKAYNNTSDEATVKCDYVDSAYTIYTDKREDADTACTMSTTEETLTTTNVTTFAHHSPMSSENPQQRYLTMIEMLKAILNSVTYFPTPPTYSITPPRLAPKSME